MMKKRLQRAVGCLALCAALAGLLTVPAGAVSFRDVPAGYWAEDAIAHCVAEGWFRGEAADRFGVGHPMNRGAFAVVLCRFFGWEVKAPEAAPYPDVPVDAWYAGAVAAAEAHGAFTRQTETFRPTEPITREELAAALVRSLGCAPLAGLVQDLPIPFTDVTTHRGYIAMAKELGILGGTGKTTFAPTHIASREQVAVVLSRLAAKRGAVPGKVGVAFGAEDLTDLAGYDAVAAAGARLLFTSNKVNVSRTMDEAELSTLREQIAASGAKGLLYVTGTANSLKGDPRDTALAISAAVKDGGWDGLFLDIAKLEQSKQGKTLAELVTCLDDMLGADKLLYVAAEAPAWQEGAKAYNGYDYAALSREADRLVVRVASYSGTVNSFPTAPVDPLEEVYYALHQLRTTVPADKLSLWMTTTGSAWKGGSREGAVSAGEIETLLAEKGTKDYYSGRYACAYLQTASQSSRVVWYLDETAVRERVDLAACFGASQICLSDLASVSAGVAAGLN